MAADNSNIETDEMGKIAIPASVRLTLGTNPSVEAVVEGDGPA